MGAWIEIRVRGSKYQSRKTNWSHTIRVRGSKSCAVSQQPYVTPDMGVWIEIVISLHRSGCRRVLHGCMGRNPCSKDTNVVALICRAGIEIATWFKLHIRLIVAPCMSAWVEICLPADQAHEWSVASPHRCVDQIQNRSPIWRAAFLFSPKNILT